ncbi:hypothetical protein ARALYDRAFT_901248 [Arabidopsis lyrata subsp. lyrata]|uniref:RNase H type-1 domain-containing protein n=2 Tax=Arabidopsis lyrata subsp. lyrata TaxID=81972 RepID=D7LBI6_ARALL|nr:hypothetical protein ARALYDRAFT_901248 [Arabidopsis lyrata subsp. lyrata]
MMSLKFARDDAKEWMEMKVAHNPGDIQPQQPETNPARYQNWQPPAIGWLKCNYDGSFVSSNLPAKSGWIIRDHNRVYMGSGQAMGGVLNDAMECELQSLIIAMQHCWTRGYQRVCFEGDNQEVVKLINGTKINFGSYNWIREVKRWKMKFDAVEFKWINRSCNKPADILAKKEIPNNSSFFFHSLIPRVISDVLQCDYYSYH